MKSGSYSLFTQDDLSFHICSVRRQKKLKLRIENIESKIIPREIWRPIQRKKGKSGILLESLPDSLIANCLFSGFLNTAEIIKSLMKVNHHLRNVAKVSVTLLDLRKFTKITPHHMARIVKCFKNVIVSRKRFDKIKMIVSLLFF